jgi:predicted dehydrogenase
MVIYDDTSNEPVRVFDSGVDVPNPETFGEFRMTYRVGDIVSPNIEVTEPLRCELADFCTAVRSGSEPRSSARLGLDVVRIAEAVDTSIRTGASVTPTPRVPA